MKSAKKLGLETAWINNTQSISPDVDYVFSNLLEIENKV
jgi:hypothetical protein